MINKFNFKQSIGNSFLYYFIEKKLKSIVFFWIFIFRTSQFPFSPLLFESTEKRVFLPKLEYI